MKEIVIKFGPMVNASSSEETTPAYTATAEIVTTVPESREYNYSRSCEGSGNWIDRSATKSAIKRDARADLKSIKTTKKDMDELAKIEYKKTLIENRVWYNTEKANIKNAERAAVEEICSLSYWRNR